MKIIDDLITELTDKNSSLTDILIKTKVLAFKLKNAELQSWINNELNGYNDEDLPEYRILPCQITGSVSNGFQRAKNFPIPIMGLDVSIRKLLQTAKLFQSVSTLEKIITSEGSKLIVNIPPEFYDYLSKDFDNDFVVEHARREIDKIQIVQTLTSIKTKLLDFLLSLNEAIGEDENPKNLTEGDVKKRLDSLFHSTVFGNNTTIIVGDHNIQNVTNISTGNFESLKEYLKSNGVNDSDISELEAVIRTDVPNEGKKSFGDKVKIWIGKMILKAVDGTWQIGIGAAGSVLADGINAFYGW
jgi:hypothetical protein